VEDTGVVRMVVEDMATVVDMDTVIVADRYGGGGGYGGYGTSPVVEEGDPFMAEEDTMMMMMMMTLVVMADMVVAEVDTRW